MSMSMEMEMEVELVMEMEMEMEVGMEPTPLNVNHRGKIGRGPFGDPLLRNVPTVNRILHFSN